MSEKAQRVFIIFIALIFLASAAAVIAYPFLDKKQNNSDLTAEQKKAVADAQNNKPQEGKLKGTQLQNFTPVTEVAALKVDTITPGSGDAVVKESDTVTVNYTGTLASTGKIFESSLDSGQPATFPLSGVIKGWTQGLPGMKVGETRRLTIPSDLAYGAQGSGATIPPNSPLVFDVTLLKIGQ